MPLKLTEKQREVVTHRGGNLLVSAAAGSGKTAVLVERIIRLITDPDHPIDIDRVLVMTFTNAAAAEMRERIGAALEQKLAESPDDEHLKMQTSLIHHAQIQTIDSFCLDLIRSYFDRLDRDPSFRVGEEGELKLLKKDVLNELIEECYEKAEPDFMNFVEAYAAGKTDADLETLIGQVCDFATSYPYPAQWFRDCRKSLASQEENPEWLSFVCDDIRCQASELAGQMADALALCQADEVLSPYVPMFTDDVSRLRQLSLAPDFSTACGRLTAFTWPKLASVSNKKADPVKKAAVTNCRDRAKKAVTKLKSLYAFASPSEMAALQKSTVVPAGVLLDLSWQFLERYTQKKKERNLIDFGDMEHEALNVLIEQQDGIPLMKNGAYCYTEVADELAKQYEEILIDEYQDSNLVQETLVQALSAGRFGRPDVFTVGDVKQSIYRFRQARPDIFLGKYNTYTESGEGAGRKIELQKNFRSRKPVITGINRTFAHIMTPNLGNILYSEETALHLGADYPESAEEEDAYMPELLLVDTGTDAFEGLSEEAADLTSKEIEARLIAGKIGELTDAETGLLISDRATGKLRRARYSDIVILLRSTVGFAETFLTVLGDEGIPVFAESQTGYFNTPEVETILSFLAVIDNPMQDIPLAATLHSPLVGLTDRELAEITAACKKSAEKTEDRGLYAAVKTQAGRDDGAGQKIRHFWDLLEKFRKASVYLPIHELILRIYEETGYYDYVSAMPAGAARKANLDMLVEKASDYEKTSYRGLFHFIRYIENLKKYDTDFGEAATSQENGNTVRIMSIHKSKGLEFPIVFLAGMSKAFNQKDLSARILIDPDLGIATDACDLTYRIKSPTLKRNALRRKAERESLGEELRVLYVAMTRAREKLIMTATDRSLKKDREKYAPGQVPVSGGQISYTLLSMARSYLDWVLMSIGAGNNDIRVTEVPIEKLVGKEFKRQLGVLSTEASFDEALAGAVLSDETAKILKKRLNTPYPYEAEIALPTKFTVSELKHAGQMIDEEESVNMALPVPGEESLGEGLPEEEKTDRKAGLSGGAARGTAVHRAMELLPIGAVKTEEEVREALVSLMQEGRLTVQDLSLIDVRSIAALLRSQTGQRLAKAQREGKLYRERQFVMGLTAREIGLSDSDEMVVIQGVIDACFEEDGAMVLIDYKTDRVYSEETLKKRYDTQLSYYARALSADTGLPVKEKILYSLTMQKEICC